VEVRIVDEDGAEVPLGSVGEVTCRSPMIFPGYWNRDAATREVLHGDWYYTGDLGHFDGDGYLYIVDRKKNMIISGGLNVFPREIEEVLYRHPSIAEAAIVGRPDEYWGEAVVAYVVPAAGETIDPAELKAFCATSLAGYKIPKEFHMVDALPKNEIGKILHRALRDRTNEPG
jgi:acyl-CoA synthetase (AMP-forming)/AMP-acid ligase II